MLARALAALLLVALTACSTSDDASPEEAEAGGIATTDPDPAAATPTTDDPITDDEVADGDQTDDGGSGALGAEGGEAPPSVPFDGERCLTSDGRERCYELLVPEGLVGPVPFVVDLHGYTGTNDSQRRTSGFADLAVDEGFVVAWPEGYEESFNAGLCCGLAVSESVDDVAFLREIVADVAALQALDQDALYLTGLSNGCAMAQRAAADASDLFDAVACFSFYLLDDPDPGYTPVPVMEIHGVLDPVVAYAEDGRGISDLLGVELGAESNAATWAELNGCDPEPEVDDRGDHRVTTYGGCEAVVALVTVPEAGHVPYPGAETEVDTVGLAWEFLTAS